MTSQLVERGENIIVRTLEIYNERVEENMIMLTTLLIFCLLTIFKLIDILGTSGRHLLHIQRSGHDKVKTMTIRNGSSPTPELKGTLNSTFNLYLSWSPIFSGQC